MEKRHKIPTGDLILPSPPKEHEWVIENTISSTGKETKYGVIVRLINPHGVTVVTVAEIWNPKVETVADFAVSVAGVTGVHLDSYHQFMAVSWDHDNPDLKVQPEENYSNRNIRRWTQK